METSKKVLFVARYLWGDEGISIHLIRLAQGLIKSGWTVGLASAIPPTDDNHHSSSILNKFKLCGIQYFYIPFPQTISHPGKLPQFFTALRELSTIIQQFKPNLLHIHSLSVSPYAHIVRLIYRLPFIATAHIEPNIKQSTILLSRFFNKLFPYTFGDRFIAISTAIETIYTHDLNVDKSRITLIYHGFDIEHFRPPSLHERIEARNSFELPTDAKVVCLIGRLDPVKGHKILYQALSHLKQEGINIFAICAGTGGAWEDKIKAQPKEFDVHNLVQFPGFTDARRVLWAADIIILPSRREGFALVIPEAMLCGVVPIRTPAAGAHDQITDGVNGLIIPFDNIDVLATALKKLFTQDILKESMGKAALASATEKFSEATMVSKTIATYLEVMGDT